jgi:glucan phosphoethanolaminetransferase (alkaline phosphatase superfamily)
MYDKEMEKQQKYSINFIMWYSGMNQQQIENAHKRWIKETSKTDKE